jgi:hypothetical protein
MVVLFTANHGLITSHEMRISGDRNESSHTHTQAMIASTIRPFIKLNSFTSNEHFLTAMAKKIHDSAGNQIGVHHIFKKLLPKPMTNPSLNALSCLQ